MLDEYETFPEEATALVTGGSGGIGAQVCRRLAASGIQVAVNYLQNRSRAEELVRDIREAGGSAEVFQANVGKFAEVGRLTELVGNRFGRIDFFVHCASLGTFSPTLSTRTSHWDLTLAVHATGFWELARSVARWMPDGGAMVALSSLGSRRYTPSYGAVGIAKGALETSVRYLAAELAPRGIRVNGVCSGPVDGERIRTAPWFSEVEKEAARRPGGRLGTGEEIADVVHFLVSPLSRWIQGQIIVADGGFSLW